MIQLLFGADEKVCGWVEHHLPYQPVLPRPATAIGITLDNSIIGGAVYHNYRTHTLLANDGQTKRSSSIEISLACKDPRWAQRWVIRTLLAYPFDQLRVTRVNALVNRSNKTWRDCLKRLGFAEEGVLRHWYADDDAVFYGLMRRDAVKWLGERKNKT